MAKAPKYPSTFEEEETTASNSSYKQPGAAQLGNSTITKSPTTAPSVAEDEEGASEITAGDEVEEELEEEEREEEARVKEGVRVTSARVDDMDRVSIVTLVGAESSSLDAAVVVVVVVVIVGKSSVRHAMDEVEGVIVSRDKW